MLTADLVQVRRRGELLALVPLEDADRARALELSAQLADIGHAHVGQPRGALTEALRAVPVSARDRRLADGLVKLLLDRCAFAEQSALPPVSLRADLFARAAEARRQAAHAGAFDRDALVAVVAAERGVSPAALDQALYADLADAHVLTAIDVAGPRTLVAAYEAGQVQAVLLRAVKVVARVSGAAPGAYRALFRKLKFLRLLHQVSRVVGPRGEDRGYEIEIDGPFSLFESVTKYGLQLALAFPAIAACGAWRLEADVRWGKARQALKFRAGGADPGEGDTTGAALPDEAAALLGALEATDTPWRAAVSTAVLDLPGSGVCIPDLELRHRESGQVVYVEVMGFWSRDAVWKRVELVERGLPFPIVFAVSKHLRVSEAALGDEQPSALLVYARTLSPRALLARVEAVAERATSSASAPAPGPRPSRKRRSTRNAP